MLTPRAAGRRPGSAAPGWTSSMARAVAAAAVAVIVTGCGGGPTPAAWAASVCQALAPWRTEISDLTVRTQQQMTAETTPAQAKENLVRLFDGARGASEQARQQVERAGVPDVADGQAIAERFVGSLAAARDAYGKARDSIAGLDTGEASRFYDEVAEVVAVLDAEYRRSALDTTNVESPELERAFDEVPECH